MAHSLSAKKRIRQNEKSRIRNRTVRSRVRNLIKKINYSWVNSQLRESMSCLKELVSQLDKSAQKGVFHKNNIARKKSIWTKRIVQMQKDNSTTENKLD